MTQFIQARLLPGLLADVSPGRRRFQAILLLVGVALVIIALTRPQWGFHLEEVKQRGLDIVVAIDTSRSMLANDIAPNRLGRAKLEAIALQQLCRTDRLGLVAFAGTAFLQCPLSLDDDAFRQGLEALDVNIIPQGGTALAEAIRTSLTAFKEKTDNHKILVLFTDGEDHDGQAVETASQAAKEGMRIFTIGVGTPNGELLATVDEQGRRSFLKDSDGNAVMSRLNETLLREIAKAANGFYLPLTGAKTMDTLYQRGLAPLPKTDAEAKTIRQYHERFPWFLALAIVLFLAEMFLVNMKPSSNLRRPGARSGLAVIVALLAGLPAVSWSAPAPAEPKMIVRSGGDEAARNELRKERELRQQRQDLEKQIADYDRRLKRHPDDLRLSYNKGTCEYAAGDYQAAEKELTKALSAPDLELQHRSYYNLGNTRYRLGADAEDPKKKMEDWQQAVSSYESALKLEPKDDDARFNLDLVKKKLEELKQQQQQQKDQQQNKDDQNKDQQNKDQQQQQNKDEQKKQQDQKQQDGQKKKDDSQQQQQKKDDQKSQQDQQQKPDPSQQQKAQKSEGQEDQQKDENQEQEAAQAGKMVRMTPQQARQLLDAQRAEEKPMPFWKLLRTNRVERVFKDW